MVLPKTEDNKVQSKIDDLNDRWRGSWSEFQKFFESRYVGENAERVSEMSDDEKVTYVAYDQANMMDKVECSECSDLVLDSDIIGSDSVVDIKQPVCSDCYKCTYCEEDMDSSLKHEGLPPVCDDCFHTEYPRY